MVDTSKNIGALLKGKRNFQLVPLEVPQLKDNEVTVAVGKVGICGSDVHFYLDGSLSGMFPLSRYIVMGHEFGGKIISVGKSAKGLAVGDRVAVEPGFGCNECEFCHAGRYNICPEERFFATTCHGSLQHFVNVPFDFCYKIPDTVSDEEAALVEPVAVGVMAARRANVQPGSVCIIHGAGPVGLCLYMVAKAMGSCKAIFTDINKGRLDFAKTLGDDIETILVEPPKPHSVAEAKAEYDDANSPARKLGRQIVEAAGCEPDICFDTTGVEVLQQAAIFALRQRGVLFLLGYHHEFNVLPMVNLLCKEIDIRSNFRYSNTYQAAVDLAVTKRLQGLDKMVTHTYPLAKCVEAFETACNANKTGAIKVMIDCNLPK